MYVLAITKKKLGDENGATSVLVIFMMIMLVSLGAFVITFSHTNYKFSGKAFEWNKMYYILDSEAEEYLSAVDAKLAQAEEKAVAYIYMGRYAQLEDSELPQDIQNSIYSEFQRGAGSEAAIESAMSRVYMYYAFENLTGLLEEYAEDSVYSLTETEDGNAVVAEVDIAFTDEEGDDKYLKVSLRVNPVDYSIAFENGVVRGKRNTETKRYVVESWYEWQGIQEYGDIIIF